MSDCVFCEILRGDRPGTLVYEDDVAVALLDLYPVHEGHTLVIPREHVRDLASCPPDLAGHLFALSGRLAQAVADATGAQAFNVWTASGKAAGQEVLHLHLHILPRYCDDSFGLRFPVGYPKEATREDLDVMAARIRARLRSG
jgi:histidine triad (HIT) family protein